MPEMRFHVIWPDGQEELCYSPSTVITEHLVPGSRYRLDEFVQRAEQGLDQASERVRKKFGFYCSGATDQLAKIHRRAEHYRHLADAWVEIPTIPGEPPTL